MSSPAVQVIKNAETEAVDAGRLKGSGLLSPTIIEWWVKDFMRPIEDFCVRRKITPNQLTFTGFAITVVAAFLLGGGHLIWGGWMMIIGACFDFFDGRVARRMKLSSVSGAFLDSVLDRYMDFAVLFGLAIYFRNTWCEYLVYLAMLGSAATPYIRAKAESLGLSSSEGAMQRPERIVYIGLGSCMSGYLMTLYYPFQNRGEELPPYILMFSLSIVAVMSNRVAIQRALKSFRELRQRESTGK